MLKLPSHSSAARRFGGLASVAIAGALAGTVYAASAPVATQGRQPSGAAVAQYQLDIQLALAHDDDHAKHSRQVKVALCMAPGEVATVETHGVALDAITRSETGQRVSIDLAVREKAGATPAHNHLVGTLRQPLHASGKVPGGNEQYVLEITPQPGCPASAAAAGKTADAPITMKVRGSTVRQVVDWIATTAGFVLVNPEAVDERQLTLNFQQVPAASAMRIVANADGMRAVFDGQRVRFEPKS